MEPGSEILRVQRCDASDGNLASLVVINRIFGLSGAMNFVPAIRLMLHELSCQTFREKDLTHVRGVSRLIGSIRRLSADPHFKVNVICAAHIESRKNSLKVYRSGSVGYLYAAKKREMIRGVVFRGKSHSPLGRSRMISWMLRIEARWGTEAGRWRPSGSHRILFRKA